MRIFLFPGPWYNRGRREKGDLMKKTIIAFIAAIFLFFSLPTVLADYTSWEDSTYDFKGVKTIYIDAMDTSESGMTSEARDMKLKEDFYKRVSKSRAPGSSPPSRHRNP